MRALRGPAAGLIGLTGAIAVGTCVLLLIHQPPPRTSLPFLLLGGTGIASATLGGVVTSHAPRNRVGTQIALVGLLVTYLAARDVYYGIWMNDHDALLLDTRLVALLDESGWWLAVAPPYEGVDTKR